MDEKGDINLYSIFPDKNITKGQIETVFKKTNEIINSFDEYVLAEIMSGASSDIDEIIISLMRTTKEIIYGKKHYIEQDDYDYLPNLTKKLDEALKVQHFAYFVQQCLPDFELAPYHIELMRAAQYYPKLNILCARDHSKSHMFSYAYPLWRCYRYSGKMNTDKILSNKENALNAKGLMVSAETSLVKGFLRQVKEEIESNPFLHKKLYPRSSNPTWAATEITTQNGANIRIKGASSSVRGIHVPWMSVDDLLTDGSLYSDEIREKTIEWFNSVLLNALDPGGSIVCVGTPFHSEDLYQHIRKKKKSWLYLEYPAILPDGSTLYPERHSIESLLEKKFSQGSMTFQREILVRPISADTSLFPYPILKGCVEETQTIVENKYSSGIQGIEKVIVGCDFAISGNIGADYSVFTVIGVKTINEMPHFFYLNRIKLHGKTYQEQIFALKKIDHDYEPNLFYAEENGFQKVMIQLMKDNGLNVKGHVTTGKNKWNSQIGLPALSVIFEQKRFHLPYKTEKDKNVVDSLFMQLNGFTYDAKKMQSISTASHDDEAMSLWVAVTGVHYAGNFVFNFLN